MSLETQEIANQFRFLLDKMQLQWEGDLQQVFDAAARDSIRKMEQFALICKEHSDDVQQVAECYTMSESLLASDVNSKLLADIID